MTCISASTIRNPCLAMALVLRRDCGTWEQAWRAPGACMPDVLTAPPCRRRIGTAVAGVEGGFRRTGCTTRTAAEVPVRSDWRSAVPSIDLAIGIGGAAGQGIATPGDVLARIFVRRGLHVNAYNAYQSIIRGGHIFLTLRTSDHPVLSQCDKIDVLVPLNQDTMDRHLRLMRP